MSINITRKPKPFIKWAGGKRQLVDILLKNKPDDYNIYIEPFVGGGAFLFAILPEKAIIFDINYELINAYKVIKENPDALIRSLKKHINKKEYFLEVRSWNPDKLNDIERASRFIYLNKTCYNGLYRENSKGQFNVPFGKYKNPNIVDEENLIAISNYLNLFEIEILHQSYKDVLSLARKRDFVYLDPPYHPLTTTASFTKYTKYDFSEKDQIELAEVFKELDKIRCYVLLSNSNTELIKHLYCGYNIQEIEANRFINCKADRRGKGYYEILVKNWN